MIKDTPSLFDQFNQLYTELSDGLVKEAHVLNGFPFFDKVEIHAQERNHLYKPHVHITIGNKTYSYVFKERSFAGNNAPKDPRIQPSMDALYTGTTKDPQGNTHKNSDLIDNFYNRGARIPFPITFQYGGGEYSVTIKS